MSITRIAEILERRGVPFLFVSGYTATGLPKALCKSRVLQKPFFIDRLKEEIELTLKAAGCPKSALSARKRVIIASTLTAQKRSNP